MFAGVHAESLHSDVHEVVEIIRDLAAHIILAPVQVVQAHQVAVPHLMQSMRLKERKNIYLSFFRHLLSNNIDASTKRPRPVFILSIKSSLNDFIPDK